MPRFDEDLDKDSLSYAYERQKAENAYEIREFDKFITEETDKAKSQSVDPDDKEHYLSGEAQVFAALIAQKKISRANSDEALTSFTFNAFNLYGSTCSEDEIRPFFQALKANLKNIPDGTRFQINLRVSSLEWGASNTLKHWFPIDFYFKDGQLNTFTFDALCWETSFGPTQKLLKKHFPEANHYQFSDTRNEKTNRKTGYLQADGMSCHLFSLFHSTNLSKIPADTLYDEIKNIADSNHNVTTKSIKAKSPLLRLLKPAQPRLTKHLSDDALDSEIKTKNGAITLRKIETERQDKDVIRYINGKNKKEKVAANLFIHHKNNTYLRKLLAFVKGREPLSLKRSINQRTGLVYVECPKLFAFDKNLTTASKDDALNALQNFTTQLQQRAPKGTHAFCGLFKAKNIGLVNNYLKELKDLMSNHTNSETANKGELVTNALQIIIELREALCYAKSTRTRPILDDLISETATLLQSQQQASINPTHISTATS